MLRLLEEEIVPRFYDRDAAGVPRAWLAMVRASIRTGGLQFSAQRMLADYVSAVDLAADRTGATP
jgi:starch phosphorylase